MKNMWHPKHWVGEVAVIMTIVQFLSGSLVCKQIIKNRTTGENTALPFIICIPSCALWLLYGIYKEDNKIILVNVIGIALMTVYTIIFYIYTMKKFTVLKENLVMVIIFFTVLLYAFSASEDEVDSLEHLLERLGLLASIFTLLTIAAPMAKLFHVFKVRSTECLPFPMILMSLVVSSLWFLYGFFMLDPFIKVVNFIGAGLAMAQLSLFLVYPNTPSSTVYEKENLI